MRLASALNLRSRLFIPSGDDRFRCLTLPLRGPLPLHAVARGMRARLTQPPRVGGGSPKDFETFDAGTCYRLVLSPRVPSLPTSSKPQAASQRPRGYDADPCCAEQTRAMDKLENAVAGALVSADAKDLAAEYAELGIDAFLEEGIAREIPVVRTILGISKVGINIRDRLFAKKLLQFLASLADTDPKERQELVQRLENDPKYGRRVGEHVTELLERIEAHRKPKMVATIFRAYLQGTIDATMLHRLNRAVELVPLHDLSELRKFCEAKEDERGGPIVSLQALHAAGLLDAASAWGGIAYLPNEVSEAFLGLDLDRV